MPIPALSPALPPESDWSSRAFAPARASIDRGRRRPLINEAAQELSKQGVQCTPVQSDLSTREGVDQLVATIHASGRPVDALLANAGRGLGRAFLDQDLEEALKVIHTNIDGTIILIHKVGQGMRSRRRGRILITGSIAGLRPGTFTSVYDGTKAFLDSFSVALSNESKDRGVTVTCLLPGATETDFFERADMMDRRSERRRRLTRPTSRRSASRRC